MKIVNILIAFLALGIINVYAADSTVAELDAWGIIGGYTSYYSSQRGESTFHDLLNFAPRDNGGLNYVAAGLTVASETLYGAVSLQYGDAAQAAWNSDMYWLQEAWLGYHLHDDVDIQLGAFTSNIGVESMTSYQNYSGIISVPGFFDPNYFAGVRLLMNVSEDLVVNLEAMTSFNGYALDGEYPAPIIGLTYRPDSVTNVSLNSMISEEPLVDGTQWQWYTNLAGTIQRGNMHYVGEINYGYESVSSEHRHGIMMISGFIGAYYDVSNTTQTGIRVEAYHDPESMLANDRFASPVPFATLSVAGVTGSISYRPTPWSLIRLDVRQIQSLNEQSFVDLNPDVRRRIEIILSSDFYIGTSGK